MTLWLPDWLIQWLIRFGWRSIDLPESVAVRIEAPMVPVLVPVTVHVLVTTPVLIDIPSAVDVFDKRPIVVPIACVVHSPGVVPNAVRVRIN